MSVKSSGFIVTSMARCTIACAAIMRSSSFRREYPACATIAPQTSAASSSNATDGIAEQHIEPRASHHRIDWMTLHAPFEFHARHGRDQNGVIEGRDLVGDRRIAIAKEAAT